MDKEQKELRPNFFVLLDIDPNKDWNTDEYQKVFRRKRNDWSRQSSMSIGQRAAQAKRNLELSSEITKVMEDRGLREKERQAAQEEGAVEREERKKLFENRLIIFNAKDSTTPEEIAAFAKEFADLYTREQVTSRITVATGETQHTVHRATLDLTRAKVIAQGLQFLHKSSLYDFLECPITSATPILNKRAKAIYEETNSIANKSQEVTYRSELAGQAIAIFANDNKRAQYDESLRLARFKKQLVDIEETLKHSPDKTISRRQVAIFLDQAQQAGWKRPDALQQLKEYARDKKWLVDDLQERTPIARIVCGNCQSLNDPGQNHCRNCGTLVFLPCPSCGERIASDSQNCGQCGFPIGNRHLVEMQLTEAQTLLINCQIQKARSILEETIMYWQPPKPDQLTQRLERLLYDLQKQEKSQQQLAEQVQRLLGQNKLLAARQVLITPEARVLSERVPQLNEIEGNIEQARTFYRQAGAQGRSNDERIKLCQQALALCSDFEEARTLLGTLPPTEPAHLQATRSGTSIHLSWSAAPTAHVTYTIVRKALSPPNSAKDGIVLGTVTGLDYDDRGPEKGLPLYYAVFSAHEKISSRKGATLTEPILLADDVTQARIEAYDHQIRLFWEVPAHAETVLIMRKEDRTPQTEHDGYMVAECPAHQTQYIDRHVQNQQSYYYTLFARFKDQNDKLIAAPGISLTAIPDAPPATIRTLIVHAVQADTSAAIDATDTDTSIKEVFLEWQPPEKGKAIILKSTRSLQQYTGKMISEDELQGLGERLEENQDSLTDRQIGNGVTYYTPVVLYNQIAYMGETQRFSNVSDVKNVRWQNLGDAIRLQWLWPPQCQEVRLAYSTEHEPRAHDSSTTEIRIQHNEYARRGYYDFHGKSSMHYYLSLTVISQQQGEHIESQGIKLSVQQAELLSVRYEIRRAGRLSKRSILYITAAQATTLPTLVLVGRQGRIPVHKADGDNVLRVEHRYVEGKGFQVELPNNSSARNLYCKLFLEDDGLYQRIEIYHPHEDKLKVQ
ncbi:transcriptional regulator [Ktedonobacteria bacterium brp13]|nr:transcriptional regulator [Ktedonobacteria bacterium brp13]